jgi:ribosomal protein S28E/S33
MLPARLRRSISGLTLIACVNTMTLASPIFIASTAHAQQRGAAPRQDLITRGRNLFDDQQYEESTQTLSAALLRPNNTKEQKIEIYRLLAYNYITMNRKDEAESAVRGLLAIDPEYSLPPSESPRFRDFFTNAKTKWEADGKPGLVQEQAAPPAPVTMAHNSPSQVDKGTDIPLSVVLTDPQHRAGSVKLLYRTGSKGKFAAIDVSIIDGKGKATIPGSAVKPPLVEYYFEAYDTGSLPIASRGDASAPLRVAVPDNGAGWVLPVAIGGGIVGVAALVLGGLAIGGVFKGSSTSNGSGPGGPKQSTVSVSIGQ